MKQAQFFYRSENAPKPNRPNHIGTVLLMEWDHKLLLERRMDSERWAVIGGGLKVDESLVEGVLREVFEETSIYLTEDRVEFYKIYDDPSIICSYPDGNILRSIMAVYKTQLAEEPNQSAAQSQRSLFFYERRIKKRQNCRNSYSYLTGLSNGNIEKRRRRRSCAVVLPL